MNGKLKIDNGEFSERPGISEELLLIVIAAVSIGISVAILIAALLFTDAGAADYFIYKDAAGKVTIGNQAPPAALKNSVKRYDWQDASEAEIAQTARENSAVEARNFERERLAAQERLAAAIAEQNALARERGEAAPSLDLQVTTFGSIPYPIPNVRREHRNFARPSGAWRARR